MEQPFDDNELRQLYDSFVKALDGLGDLSAFSDDDLLDIYDYTRSLADDSVAFEALMAGLDRYPDNEDFHKRILFFFHDLDQDAMLSRLKNHLPKNAPLRPFIGENFYDYCSRTDDDALYKDLFSKIPRASLEDGEILFMIDRLVDARRINFVRNFSEQIAHHCQYPSTIYQELYRLAKEQSDFDSAAEFARKLTEIEPFNAQFWIELADAQSLANDDASALETIEYALAINPDNFTALLTKANLMAESNPQYALEIVNKLDRNPQADFAVCLVKSQILFLLGQPDQALMVLTRPLNDGTLEQKRSIFDLIFAYLQSSLPQFFLNSLRSLISADPLLDDIQWAMDCYREHKYAGVISIITSSNRIDRYNIADDVVAATCESFYRLGLMADMKKFVADLCKNYRPIAEISPAGALIYCLASIYFPDFNREAITQTVSQAIKVLSDQLMHSTLPIGNRLVNESLLQRFNALEKSLLGDTTITRRSFDPFI